MFISAAPNRCIGFNAVFSQCGGGGSWQRLENGPSIPENLEMLTSPRYQEVDGCFNGGCNGCDDC